MGQHVLAAPPSGSRGGSAQQLTPPADAARSAARKGAAHQQVHEGLTMALYVSLSLLAVMVALPPGAGRDSASPALEISVTSAGLILAHQLAFRLSSRLVQRGRVRGANAKLLAAQLLGGLAVTVVAVTPVLVVDGSGGVHAAEVLLLAFIAVVGYLAARAVPLGRARAVTYVAIVAGLTLGVLWVKTLAAH